MGKIRSFNDKINVKNKRVILRLDFNVPLKKQLIQDKTNLQIKYVSVYNIDIMGENIIYGLYYKQIIDYIFNEEEIEIKGQRRKGRGEDEED